MPWAAENSSPSLGKGWQLSLGREETGPRPQAKGGGGESREWSLAEVFICRAGGGLQCTAVSLGQEIFQTGVSRV